MSKVGKLPISIIDGVTVNVTDGKFMVKGKLGELSVDIPNLIKVEQKENQLIVTRVDDSKEAKSLHGLVRSLIDNAIKGVTEGFSKQLEINGVGFKATVQGDKIVLNIGFSHPVTLSIIEGVEIKQEKNKLTISGIDKQKVGQMAAEIRATKKPEPYKGKGIKYVDEIIQRKAGKAAKTAA